MKEDREKERGREEGDGKRERERGRQRKSCRQNSVSLKGSTHHLACIIIIYTSNNFMSNNIWTAVRINLGCISLNISHTLAEKNLILWETLLQQVT